MRQRLSLGQSLSPRPLSPKRDGSQFLVCRRTLPVRGSGHRLWGVGWGRSVGTIGGLKMIEGGKNETNGQIKHEHYHDYTMTILPGHF